MNKLTVEQSEWLWAINRNKAAEYYASRYGYHRQPSDFTISRGGWIVKDILSSSDYLLKKAFEMFNMDFQLLIMIHFPDNKWGLKQALSREEICWLMFYSTAYSIMRKEMDQIIEGDWQTKWAELDKEFNIE